MPRPHLEFDPRRRYRDRLLLGMVVVAVVPLGIFATSVAADLGAISRGTVDETHRTIVEDQEARQEGQVADRAKVVDTRLAAIAGEVSTLGDTITAANTPPATTGNGTQPAPAGTAPPGAPERQVFSQAAHGVWYAGADSSQASTLIVTSTSPLVPELAGGAPSAVVGEQSLGVVPLMLRLRSTYPEVDGVWVADLTSQVVRTVPWTDVNRAIDEKRLDPQRPPGAPGDPVFSTSAQRMNSVQGADGWQDPASQPRRGIAGPYWTDPYLTRESDGVTVWERAGNSRFVVGADIGLDKLRASIVNNDLQTEPNAYPILLSSSGSVLSAGTQVEHDFGLRPAAHGGPAPWIGRPLPLERYGAGALAGIERTGRGGPVHVNLGGVDKVVFTAPVSTAHWVLAAAIPAIDLEPDAAALKRGVDSGLHRILIQTIPVALMLLVLALILATFFARRLVGPVRALTVAADRLARGHTDEVVPPQGRDEVGQLATSLERMRQEVNSSRDAILAAAHELEGRVAERTTELRVRNEELVALNALAGSLTTSLDPAAILNEALDTVAAVVPLITARAWLITEGEVESSVHLGSTSTHEVGLRRIAMAAVEERRLVRRPSGNGELVGIPLETGEGALGALSLVVSEPTAVGRTAALLDAIADQVGLALRTAQLSAEGRELAVLEERTRLAREIHDTLAQQLTAIVLQLEAAEAFVDRDQADARAVIVSAREQARSALQEARRSVWDLRPAPLAATGLVAAITLEVERWGARTGVDARVRSEGVTGPLALDAQAEVALLRICQEALSNIGHHSSARAVLVELLRRGERFELRITDDGSGFEQAGKRRAGSFGLLGMEERARLAHGTLEVESTPGRGTQVRVHVPLGEAVVLSA